MINKLISEFMLNLIIHITHKSWLLFISFTVLGLWLRPRGWIIFSLMSWWYLLILVVIFFRTLFLIFIITYINFYIIIIRLAHWYSLWLISVQVPQFSFLVLHFFSTNLSLWMLWCYSLILISFSISFQCYYILPSFTCFYTIYLLVIYFYLKFNNLPFDHLVSFLNLN